MSAKRLLQGGQINRNVKIRFSWNDTKMTGYAGDSLASALMANGETLLGRSFKYHRPRGIMSAGVEESGAIVTVGRDHYRDPNVKATTQEIFEGLYATGQNAWPSLKYDIGAVNDFFSRFLAAGFYYKTFMGIPPMEWGHGTGIWMKYEKIIRKAAGMGSASREADPDTYDQAHSFCDVLIVGSGPAGLAAAKTAAKAGLDVVLVEQDHQLGGDFLNEDNPETEKQRREWITELEQLKVRFMLRTTAFGLYDYATVGLLERVTDHLAKPNQNLPRQRFWTLRTKQIVLATGAMERHIAFGNNDRPGVMTATAGRSYLNRYAILPGQNVFITTNNDSVYQTATELAAAGARVNLLDARPVIAPSLMTLAGNSGVNLRTCSAVANVLGNKAVRGLEIATTDQNRWSLQSREPCDLILVSGGWSPVVHLLSHRGIKPVWNAELACFTAPDSIHEPVHMAGSAAAIWNRAECIRSGTSVGAKVAKLLGATVRRKAPPAPGGWETPIQPLYEVRLAERSLKCFVDFQHDVSSDDIRLADREGFVSVEHLKRYTTLGMATDGGKVGNIIGLALMAEAQGKDIADVGTTTFRPPYTPVALGALKGRHIDHHFRPLRRTPMHRWNLEQGATMTMAGLWQRPWYFARSGEDINEAYIREAETTRRRVGLCDVTSLGKIAIQGPDASEFINRIYTNAFAKLPVGKARYGIMLRDDGIVMDDGTSWRLSETDYFMTTTTALAGKVMVWLEELLQTRWQNLRVHLTSVSDQWAGCALAGPKSRELLQSCVADATLLSDAQCPFMAVREVTLKNGIPCRIARISFSGEMAFEIYVASDYAPALADLLWTTAKPFTGCLYGLEALGTLRIEKGHVTGAELDGRVTIDDAGLGKMASTTKSFIGSALRKRPDLQRQDRPQLVGIKTKNSEQTFNAGAILCRKDQVSGLGEGWVTAVTHSPALGYWIGLGFIAGGYQAWQGETVIAADPVREGNTEVEITSPHMYDPSGERMYG